jgi:predicted transcriptional regulator
MNINIFMPTTVHIPAPLLRRIDSRAKSLGVSRNRLIVQAIEDSLESRRTWPPELVRLLQEPLDAETARTFEQSVGEARRRRTSRRRPPEL